MPVKVHIPLEFTVPTEMVLESARKMASSMNNDEQTVGKTLLELTDITKRTMAAMPAVGRSEATATTDTAMATFDLAVYFDFDFGESLEAAKRLALSPNEQVRYVAEALYSQFNTVKQSKAAFMTAAHNSNL